jgi:hypothetical protein
MDPEIRASDAEREQTVVALREHLLDGRLTLEEFTERIERAYGAKVHGELAAVQSDLPARLDTAVPTRRRPTRVTAALFAHVVRRGRLRLKGSTLAAAAFSDIDLDLREAQIDASTTRVNVVALFGNVDVYVPAGVDVAVGGVAIFGHRRDWGRDVARPGAPSIHIRTLGLFATVDVWRVPADARGDYGALIRGLRDGQDTPELDRP